MHQPFFIRFCFFFLSVFLFLLHLFYSLCSLSHSLSLSLTLSLTLSHSLSHSLSFTNEARTSFSYIFLSFSLLFLILCFFNKPHSSFYIPYFLFLLFLFLLFLFLLSIIRNSLSFSNHGVFLFLASFSLPPSPLDRVSYLFFCPFPIFLQFLLSFFLFLSSSVAIIFLSFFFIFLLLNIFSFFLSSLSFSIFFWIAFMLPSPLTFLFIGALGIR
ncbi:unnamed protein product [Acanthosepion pharaonis]|uniref:Uncharacterized protein n=1 Tax=Acanthosepion pharaonis TaxID=158019 RepID=A0A812EL90_ACAPH|nr:unnamed protein product [Sepia pharaonis]